MKASKAGAGAAKGGGANAVPMLKQAVAIFNTFVQKAGGTPEFADAVKRAKDRAQDLGDTIKFIEEGQTAAAIEAAKQEKEQQEGPKEGEGEGAGEGSGDAKPQ